MMTLPWDTNKLNQLAAALNALTSRNKEEADSRNKDYDKHKAEIKRKVQIYKEVKLAEQTQAIEAYNHNQEKQRTELLAEYKKDNGDTGIIQYKFRLYLDERDSYNAYLEAQKTKFTKAIKKHEASLYSQLNTRLEQREYYPFETLIINWLPKLLEDNSQTIVLPSTGTISETLEFIKALFAAYQLVIVALFSALNRDINDREKNYILKACATNMLTQIKSWAMSNEQCTRESSTTNNTFCLFASSMFADDMLDRIFQADMPRPYFSDHNLSLGSPYFKRGQEDKVVIESYFSMLTSLLPVNLTIYSGYFKTETNKSLAPTPGLSTASNTPISELMGVHGTFSPASEGSLDSISMDHTKTLATT